jgi:thioredoxin reductase
MPDRFDVVIVGGGAAGLSAALILGRARRRALVIDDGHRRNAAVEASHGFFTRDGVPPAELIRLSRAELAAYPSIEFLNASVLRAARERDGFALSLESGATIRAKRLLLATGVFDVVPDIDGLAERWGKSVFVCPFCDGWEVQGQRIAVYGKGRDAVELAQELHGWSDDLVVCVMHDDLTDRDRRWIVAAHASFRVGTLCALSEAKISAMTMTFENDERDVCDALFLSAPLRQHSPLFAQLGCEQDAEGRIVVDRDLQTTVEGCYAAGDAVTTRHQVVIAAASGASAAIALNCQLLETEAEALACRLMISPKRVGRIRGPGALRG